jgi:hypothetical protein
MFKRTWADGFGIYYSKKTKPRQVQARTPSLTFANCACLEQITLCVSHFEQRPNVRGICVRCNLKR